MKLYHISRDLNFKSNFYPRIPKFTQDKEDYSINRICFATSIEKALTAMVDNIANEDNYIDFKPFFRVYEYNITQTDGVKNWEELYRENLVLDSFITEETWILNEIYFDKKDSYIIGIVNFDSDMEDLIPSEIYYESMKTDGDYLGLYVEKIGSRIPFIYTVKNLDYFKISDDLKELDNINENTYRLSQKMLLNSAIPEIENSLVVYKDGTYNQVIQTNLKDAS